MVYKNVRSLRLCSLASLLCVASFLLPLSAHADDLFHIYTLALQQDAELGEARARFQAEHTMLDQGRSGLLPTISLNGRTARNARAAEEIFSYRRPFNTHSYGISLRQSLVNFQNWYSYQSAKAGDIKARATLTRAEQGVIIRVATAYFDVLRSQDTLIAYQAEEDAAAAKLEEIKRRYDVGLEAITDVNAEQAQYDLTRVNRINEERRLNQRRLSLELITGQNHDDIAALREDFPIVSIEPDSVQDWIAMAVEHSPSIHIAQADFDAKIQDAKAARAASLPTLSLGVSYDRNAEAMDPYTFLSGTPNKSASIQLSVSVPLYSGGYDRARKRQAYYSRDASEQVLVRIHRENERSTRDSFLGVESGVIAVAAQQQVIISARSALEAVEVGAEVGTHNTYDVVLAQRSLYQALRDYAGARYDYILNTLELKQAAGVLTPDDIGALNEWLD